MTTVSRRLNTAAATTRPAVTGALAKPPRTLRAAENDLRLAQMQGRDVDWAIRRVPLDVRAAPPSIRPAAS